MFSSPSGSETILLTEGFGTDFSETEEDFYSVGTDAIDRRNLLTLQVWPGSKMGDHQHVERCGERGLRKNLGEMFVIAGVEAHYSRESWTDPYQDGRCTIDSLSVGPAVGIGTMMDLSLCLLRFDMGLVFPDLDDVLGRIGLSLLIH